MANSNKSKRLRLGLSSRVPTLTVISVLIVTIIVTIISHILTKETLQTTLQNEQWARIESIAQGLDGKFSSRRTTLKILAETIPSNLKENPQDLQKFLTTIPSLKSAFDNVSILDLSGNLVANLNGPNPIGKINVRDRDYFIKTIASGQSVISKPYRNRYNGSPQIAITQPLMDSAGMLKFIISGSINLKEDNFLGEFASVSFGKTGYMFIFNTDGVLVDHPDKKRILTVINGPGHTTAPVNTALAGFQGTMTATSSYGVHGLYVYKRLQNTDWILGGIYPTAEAFESIDRLQRRAITYAIVLAILMGLISALVMRRQLRPLATLRDTMRMDAATPSREVVRNTFSDDELGIIANAYYDARDASTSIAKQLSKSEQHLRDILTHAGDAFVGLNASGEVVEWNRQAEITFGWARHEVIGMQLAELIVPPESRVSHDQGIKHFAKTGTGEVINKLMELNALHRDGHRIAIELSVAASFNGESYVASAFIRDITAKKESEQLLRANEKFLRTITHNIPILIGYAGIDERYQFANAGYKSFLGIDPEAVVGKSMREVLGERSYAEVAPNLVIVKNGVSIHFERTAIINDKMKHFMGDYIPDISTDGAVVGFFILVLDISERKEAEIAQAHSRTLAESASRAKSDFVANMSHEIRTPMNAVLGITQLLARTSLNAEQEKYLAMIDTSGKSLLRVINDVLDFSKIDAGRLEIAETPFQLTEIVNAVAAVMTASSVNNDIELVISIDPNTPSLFYGDALRLQQVLLNLISNALKFTRSGEIVFSVNCVRSEQDVALLEFWVRDTGIGISASQLSRLYTPFEQADSSTSRTHGGTGLGLAIAKQLTKLMGGRLDVNSVVGTGSVFKLEISLRAFRSMGEKRNTRRAYHLLIVEDNINALLAIENIVKSWKWTCEKASNIMAAREILARTRSGSAFDAIVIDYELFDQSELRRELFPHGESSQLMPVIVTLNSYAYRNKYPSSKGAEKIFAILKPLTSSSLYDSLNEALLDDFSTQIETTKNSNSQLESVRILLVEDNEINQFVARKMLEDSGAIVVVAVNGKDAFEILSRGKIFDIILMDIQMPVLDGYAATGLIRNLLQITTPIIAMSAGVMLDEQEACRLAGMDGFIAKPIERDQMIQSIYDFVVRSKGTVLPSLIENAVASTNEYFDISSLLRVAKGNQAHIGHFKTIVEKLISNAIPDLKRAIVNFNEGNSVNATRIIHSLRGSVGTLGAKTFSHISIELEAAIQNDNPVEVATLFSSCELALQKTVDAATEWLSNTE